MIPTNQPTTLSLTQICEAYEAIAKDAAATEAAVTVAEEEYKVSKFDDGKTDPAEIFDRKTAAKKKLFVCEAEAKRAATRLQAAEADFSGSIENMAAPILDELTKVRNRNAEQLTKELAAKLSKGNSEFADNALRSFVNCCTGVAEFDAATGAIQHGIQRLDLHGPQSSGLIRALKQAERLL